MAPPASGDSVLTTTLALAQDKLNSMMGKSSGFIETLPRQMRARIEFLRELQDKHDDLADEYSKELKALREKYEALYGAPSCALSCGLIVVLTAASMQDFHARPVCFPCSF